MYEQSLTVDLEPVVPVTATTPGITTIVVDVASTVPLTATGSAPEMLDVELSPPPPILAVSGGIDLDVTGDIPDLTFSVDAPAVVLGIPGPAGPAGAQGQSSGYRGMYNWQTSPDQTVPLAGQVCGLDIPAVNGYGTLYVNQIDANNLNMSFFTVVPGEHVLVRDSNYAGLHDLVVMDRTGFSDYVAIQYWVKTSTPTTVLGQRCELSVYAVDPAGGPITGPPGPVGPQGPQGIPGTGSANKLTFNFATPATTWTINHNLNGPVEVNCFDPSGTNQYDVEIDYPTPNQAVVSWYYPTAGIAEVIG